MQSLISPNAMIYIFQLTFSQYAALMIKPIIIIIMHHMNQSWLMFFDKILIFLHFIYPHTDVWHSSYSAQRVDDGV